MNIFTFSDARQQFAHVLSIAQDEGKVYIRRKDGTLFSITPEKEAISPFAFAKGKTLDLDEQEILEMLEQNRARDYGGLKN